jgi:hypothetical protein
MSKVNTTEYPSYGDSGIEDGQPDTIFVDILNEKLDKEQA